MGDLRERAESEAIQVFATNLKDLLMAAPAGQRATIGLDPGLRTGVKVAVVDGTGRFLDEGAIYPHAPRSNGTGPSSSLPAGAENTAWASSPLVTAPPPGKPISWRGTGQALPGSRADPCDGQ